MTTSDLPMDTGVCEKCGSGVHFNEEGRVACDGCDRTTDSCACGDQT
ncbi:MAG: hypothetical protein ACRD12_05860 [Acidimicrobiales bacterium]